MKIWFYAKGGDRFGPFTADELKSLAAAGTLHRTDLIWKEGLADWVPATSEDGLFPSVSIQIPPRIPPSNLSATRTSARRPIGMAEHSHLLPQPDSFSRTLVIAAAISLAVLCLYLVASHFGSDHYSPQAQSPAPAVAAPLKGADALREANRCYGTGDLVCTEKNLRAYLDGAPQDARSLALMGIALSRQGQHAQAVDYFERALNLGWATYDTFAYYASSLAALGRIDDAIKWNYRALATVPNLADVSGTLAQQLTQRGHADEALALLTAFDEELVSKGSGAYFMAQRIVIEDKLEQQRSTEPTSKKTFEVANLGGHFSVPIKLGEARYTAFIVDTGATTTLVSNQMLVSSKVRYVTVNRDATGSLADGRLVKGSIVKLDDVLVGSTSLKNLEVFACDTCGLLLGQNALKHFDLHSAQKAGVEFLTLTER